MSKVNEASSTEEVVRSATPVKLLVIVLYAFSSLVYFAIFVANTGSDFHHFYSAAHMLLDGKASLLYDIQTQYQYQSHYTGEVGALFNYPPLTAVLYLPTTLFDYRHAFLLWCLLNIVVLFVFSSLFTEVVGWDAWQSMLLLITFIPASVCFLHGQVGFLLLLVYAMVLRELRAQRSFVAGLILAVGLLKFHLVLPFALIMALRQQWRFVTGFVVGSAIFAAACVAISGPHFVSSYAHLLTAIPDMSLGGLRQGMMPTPRGLFYLIAKREPSKWMVVASSALLLLWAARKKGSVNADFCAALIATISGNYHAYPHDAVVLAIPLLVALRTFAWNARKIIVMVLLGIPVVPAILVTHGCFALALLPILALASLFEPSASVEKMATETSPT